MKQKHTQAKKARRASWFSKSGNSDAMSEKRMEKRLSFQPKAPYTKGLQVIRLQRIFLKKDRFGAPLYKVIPHAAYRRNMGIHFSESAQVPEAI